MPSYIFILYGNIWHLLRKKMALYCPSHPPYIVHLTVTASLFNQKVFPVKADNMLL